MRIFTALCFSLLSATAEPSQVRSVQIGGNYAGLIRTSSPENDGLLSLDLLNTGRFTGFLLIDGYKFSIRGSVGDDPSTFGFEGTIATFNSEVPRARIRYILRAVLNSSSRVFAGAVIVEDDGLFDIDLNPSRSERPFTITGEEPSSVSDALQNQRLTGFIDPPSAGSKQEIPGDGFSAVTVGRRGTVRYVGQLPDAEKYSFGGRLHGASVALFAVLYNQGGKKDKGGFHITSGFVGAQKPPRSRGVVLGQATVGVLQDPSGEQRSLEASLDWNKQSGTDYYPGGFTVNVAAAARSYPPTSRNSLVPIGVDKAKPDNTKVKLRRGNLPEDLEIVLDLRSGRPRVLRTIGFEENRNPYDFKLAVQPLQGTFSGSFVHPASKKRTRFKGAFLPKTEAQAGEGRGSFRGSVADRSLVPPESGSIRITPN